MMTCICVIHSILPRKNTNNITNMTSDSVYTLTIYCQYYTIMAVHSVVFGIIHYMMTCIIGVIYSILARKSINNITNMTPDSVYTLTIYCQYYSIMAVH